MKEKPWCVFGEHIKESIYLFFLEQCKKQLLETERKQTVV